MQNKSLFKAKKLKTIITKLSHPSVKCFFKSENKLFKKINNLNLNLPK